MQAKDTLITAAGGNGTAIRTLADPLSERADYANQGRELGERMEPSGAEQAGFWIPGERHFEMAGGEFCGNASRAVAVIMSEEVRSREVSFTVSGFDGTVTATVEKKDPKTFFVHCTFPGMPTKVQDVTLAGGQRASVVDLGGIVHVVIEGAFPHEESAYRAAHRAIMDELGLSDREAVGVVWFERQQGSILIHPVVWVKGVDTFFYEQSCGSGSIAVGRVTGESAIVQPTGKTISVKITSAAVELESEMEVVQ